MNRFAAIFLFVVTACVAEADDGVVNNEAEEWACVEKGGRYEIGGILGRNNCVLPTADAEKCAHKTATATAFVWLKPKHVRQKHQCLGVLTCWLNPVKKQRSALIEDNKD